MKLNKNTWFENVTAPTSEVFAVNNGEILKLGMAGTATSFNAILYASMDDKTYTPIALLDDASLDLVAQMNKVGLYTADITGYLWLKLEISELSGGDISCYASMSTN